MVHEFSILLLFELIELVSTNITPSFTKNSIALTNSISEIRSFAHHPAVFFTQSGTDSDFSKLAVA